MRCLQTLFRISISTLIRTSYGSSIDPLNLLEEKGCRIGEPINEDDHGNPLCFKYRISTLTSTPHRCMHISSQPVTDGKAAEICTDFPNWTDGTNGCSAYSKPGAEDWCNTYGDIARPGGYGAEKACCVCGGGAHRYKAQYQIGDLVKVPHISQECILKVVGIQETFDSKYTLEILNTCYVTNMYGMITREYKAKKRMRTNVDDKDPELIYRVIELRKCRPGSKEQEFWVIPQKDTKTLDKRIIIKHVITGTTLNYEKSNLMNLERVFLNNDEDGGNEKNEDGDTTFEGSEQFVYITNDFNYNSRYLISGYFGQNDFSEVRWFSSRKDLSDQPYSMWSFNRVEDNDSVRANQHSRWLEQKIKDGHLDYLKQLAPWHLLDVERDAPKNEVKSMFRMLSRDFHPDKRGGALFEQVFMLLQQAYDGLKQADEKDKEKFRINAEVESQLFPHSDFVVELLPSDWETIGNGARARYVISTNSSKTDITGETLNNITNETEEKSSQIWLLFLYSPRCGMSRTVVSMLELAAKQLVGENIRVGAYGCGLYGESLENSKSDGFVGWLTDPICKQFQRRETPNTHVVVEALSGSQDFKERTAQFASFYSAAATGTIRHLWPRRLIDFARKGKRGWDDSFLVDHLTRDDFKSPLFHNETRVIVFINNIEEDESAHEVQDAILSALPHVARRLQNASIHVSVASCAAEAEEDPKLIDCSSLFVSWLPDVKVYGVNQTRGRSLVREDFIEARDAQIALEVMTNTLAAQFGLDDDDDDDDSLLEEEEEELEDNQGGGECHAPQPQPTDEDEQNLQLDGSTELSDLNNHPENPEIENVSQKKKIDGKPEKPKLANETARAKLAERKKSQGVPNLEKRKSVKNRGGGTILGHGAEGGGFGGAIAG